VCSTSAAGSTDADALVDLMGGLGGGLEGLGGGLGGADAPGPTGGSQAVDPLAAILGAYDIQRPLAPQQQHYSQQQQQQQMAGHMGKFPARLTPI